MSNAGYGIREDYLESSATLPSSAVERLFSAAALVLTVRRCRMSDETLSKSALDLLSFSDVRVDAEVTDCGISMSIERF